MSAIGSAPARQLGSGKDPINAIRAQAVTSRKRTSIQTDLRGRNWAASGLAAFGNDSELAAVCRKGKAPFRPNKKPDRAAGAIDRSDVQIIEARGTG